MQLRGVVTIDGPGGAGKSTVARALAQRLGVQYLDTGALYRAVGLWLQNQGLEAVDSPDLAKALERLDLRLKNGRLWIDGRDVTDNLRSAEAGMVASRFGALPSVRAFLLDLQREQALGGPLVADGRDMGTVVFPLAPVKVFLTADARVRAQRRVGELERMGRPADLTVVEDQIRARDLADSTRTLAPLKPAEDAVTVDSSNMTVEQVVDRLVQLCGEVTYGA